jgi:Flp pilus assembly pilin Flp
MNVGADERGQTTTEYALVMLAAAAVAGMLLAWATKGHAVTKLFDAVIEKAMP